MMPQEPTTTRIAGGLNVRPSAEKAKTGPYFTGVVKKTLRLEARAQRPV